MVGLVPLLGEGTLLKHELKPSLPSMNKPEILRNNNDS